MKPYKLGRPKLTPADVIRIRQLRSEGVRNKDLAKSFNVSPTTITHICQRFNWKDI